MNDRKSEDPVDRLSRVDIKSLPPDGGERYNRLIFNKSPYLLQHAENPVDWYSWGEDAFAKAEAEDKPVFLSIGYSTCHWCHVMEHESFEDEEVAVILNRHFVSIKVDREERPDLDATYMAVCQMMTGSGGWPLNLVLTPGKKPFFAATYLSKTSRMGMAGLTGVLEKIAELWITDRSRLLRTGEEASLALRQMEKAVGEKQPLSDAPLQEAFRQYMETFDRKFGGFGSAPKFPAPHNLSLLFRIWDRWGEEKAKMMALQSLRQIRMGGIYDQLGFGLHRYSVDARWLVPHFEKMLYDQALAVLAYLDAFQVTAEPFYAETAKEILEYTICDLRHPEGGFYCGEDADSEGAEGTFYVWTPGQVKEVLGLEAGEAFCDSYGITEEGDSEGKSIPRLDEDFDMLAQRIGVSVENLSNILAESRGKLLAARRKRIHPHRDDKILTAWNGLVIVAFSRAGAILGEAHLLDAARKAADFILERLRNEKGRLLRRFRSEEAVIPAFLEDYAFFTWGLIELYMAGFETNYLKTAVELAERMEELFSDGRGGYFDTGSDTESILTRGRSLQDGAVPSGNSVAALNLLRLGKITGNRKLEERGEELLQTGLEQVSRYPSAYAQFLIALDYALGAKTEVVLTTGRDGALPESLLGVLRSRFLPRTVVLLRRCGDKELDRVSLLTAGKEPVEGRATAYLCREETCRPPVTSASELSKLLKRDVL